MMDYVTSLARLLPIRSVNGARHELKHRDRQRKITARLRASAVEPAFLADDLPGQLDGVGQRFIAHLRGRAARTARD